MSRELKLTRAQELRLIKLGIETLLDKIYTNTPPKTRNYKPWNKGLKGTGAHKWSAEQHKKFAATMKKKWAEKKAAKK